MSTLWTSKLHPFDKQHVIEIQYNDVKALSTIKSILQRELFAVPINQTIGPYFTLIDYSIEDIQVSLIEDDTEGYPIYITCNLESSFDLMNRINLTLQNIDR